MQAACEGVRGAEVRRTAANISLIFSCSNSRRRSSHCLRPPAPSLGPRQRQNRGHSPGKVDQEKGGDGGGGRLKHKPSGVAALRDASCWADAMVIHADMYQRGSWGVPAAGVLFTAHGDDAYE